MQSLYQDQMPKAVGSFVLRARRSRGSHTRLKGTGRRIWVPPSDHEPAHGRITQNA